MREFDFQLRNAGPGDRDVVFALFAQVQSIHSEAEPDFFRPPANDAFFERFFVGILDHPEQHLVLASARGTAIGYVQYFLGTRAKNVYSDEQRVAYINQMAVSAGHRRRGCGSALIDHVKQQARSAGVRRLGIDCWSFNAAAQACFAKAGFAANQAYMWTRL